VSRRSVLRTELRLSVGPGIAAITVVLALSLQLWLGYSDPDGKTEPVQIIYLTGMQHYYHSLLWPLVLGAGALQGIRDRRFGVLELVNTTSLPNDRRTLPTAAAVTLWLTAAYLVVILVEVVDLAGKSSYLNSYWMREELLGILALDTAGLLGMGLGRLAPSRLTPPLATVAALAAVCLLAVTDLSSPAVPPNLLVLGPDLGQVLPMPDLGFEAATNVVTVGQALWFAGLASTGVILLCADRPWAKVAAADAAVLGLVAALITLPPNQYDESALDPFSCAGGGPTVCVNRVQPNVLTVLVGPARQALGDLAALPNAPTAVVADTRTTGDSLPPTWQVTVNLNDGGQLLGAYLNAGKSPHRLSPDQTTLAVLAAAMFPVCVEPFSPPDRPVTVPPADQTGLVQTSYPQARAAQAVAVSWLLGQKLIALPDVPYWRRQIEPIEQAAWRMLRSLPPDRQRDRIAAVRAAAATCDANLLTALNTGPGPNGLPAPVHQPTNPVPPIKEDQCQQPV
jgi:hypothetical protein